LISQRPLQSVKNSLAVATHGCGLEQFGKYFALPLLAPQVLKVFRVQRVLKVWLVQQDRKVLLVRLVQYQMLQVRKVQQDLQVFKV
jgi:hypothetical protein